MALHSSTLAWKIPGTEEPGGLQSMGLLRVGHDRATSLSRIGEGNGNLLLCSCLENPRDGGAWWAAVYGVAQSRRRLKRLSTSNVITDKIVFMPAILLFVFLMSYIFLFFHSLLLPPFMLNTYLYLLITFVPLITSPS